MFPTKFTDEQTQRLTNTQSELIKNEDPPLNQHYITVTYVKKISEKFCRNITIIFEDIGVKLRVAYKTKTVGK